MLRDPLVTDVLVFGADPVRVDRADGTHHHLPPLVRRPRDLERIIYATASARHRPFNREHPFVDLELEPGVRFHGEGYDVVQRPLVTVRRAALHTASLADLTQRGMLPPAAGDLLRTAVAAHLNILVCGRMGSGKTTLSLGTRLTGSSWNHLDESDDWWGVLCSMKIPPADVMAEASNHPTRGGLPIAEIKAEPESSLRITELKPLEVQTATCWTGLRVVEDGCSRSHNAARISEVPRLPDMLIGLVWTPAIFQMGASWH